MRVCVLHPDLSDLRNSYPPESRLEEAINLTNAIDGLKVSFAEIITIKRPKAGTLFGDGKLQELSSKIKEQIDLVIIDGPLTPIQQRNLEREWGAKVIDRTGLILEIFGERAATREGVLQVELAHLNYQKSRLVRSWTHLERQRGGVGFLGGPGERQIESDRRALQDQITRLKKRLAKVAKTRGLHREARKKVPFPIVALVGYTNAGKSTLFNTLTGSSVFAKSMLFATLDPTMRALQLPSGQKIILSDTVGFISDLPTELIAAFRATLEEVTDADIILHVRDIAHEHSDAQAQDVIQILENLGVSSTNSGQHLIEVWNKADLLTDAEKFEKQHIATRNQHYVVSAKTGAGLDVLIDEITNLLTSEHHFETIFLAHEDGKARAWLYERNLVLDETYAEEKLIFKVKWSSIDRDRFALLFGLEAENV